MALADFIAGLFGRDPRTVIDSVDVKSSLFSTKTMNRAQRTLERAMAAASKRRDRRALFSGAIKLSELCAHSGDVSGMRRALKTADSSRVSEQANRILSMTYQRYGRAAYTASNPRLARELMAAARKLGYVTSGSRELLATLVAEGKETGEESITILAEYLAGSPIDPGVVARVEQHLRSALSISKRQTPAARQRLSRSNRLVLDAGLSRDWAWRNIGRDLLFSGKWKQALPAFDRARAVSSADPSDLFHAAYCALQMQDLKRAASLVEGYVTINPESAAYRLLGVCLGRLWLDEFARGPTDRGEAELEAAIKPLEEGLGIAWQGDELSTAHGGTAPGVAGTLDDTLFNVSAATLLLGDLLRLSGRSQRALAVLGAAAGGPELQAEHALLLAEWVRPADALPAVERAIVASPGDVRLFTCSVALRAGSDPDAAGAVLDRFPGGSASGDPVVRLLRVRLALERGDWVAASERLAGLDADDKAPPLLRRIEAEQSLSRGRISLLEDRPDQALEWFERSARRADDVISWADRAWCDRHSASVSVWIGAAHAHSGDVAQAEDAFVRALEANPRDACAAAQLALLCLSRGDLAGAEQWISRGRSIDPDDLAVLFASGRLAELEGDRERARQVFRSLPATSGYYPVLARLRLAVMHERDGDIERAAELYRNVIWARPAMAGVRRRLAVMLGSAVASGRLADAAAPEAARLLGEIEFDPASSYLYALMLSMSGDTAAALEAIGLLEGEGDAVTRDCRAECLIRAGRFGEARELWALCADETGSELFARKIAHAYFLEAREVLTGGGAAGVTAKLLDSACALAPADSEYRLMRAAADIVAGNYREAEQLLEQLRSGDCPAGTLLLDGFNCLLANEDPEPAVEKLRAAAAVEPVPMSSLARLIVALHCDVPGEAVVELQAELARTVPGGLPFDEAVLTLPVAVGMARSGRANEALDMVQSLQELRPEDTGLAILAARLAAYHAARKLRERDVDGALTWLNRAISGRYAEVAVGRPKPTGDGLQTDAATESEQSDGLLNINLADRKELESLPGVGPALAQRIADYRGQHGPFGRVEDLKLVPGIGPRLLEQITGMVTTGGN